MRRSLARLSRADLEFLLQRAPPVPSREARAVARACAEPRAAHPPAAHPRPPQLESLKALIRTKAPAHTTSERISALFQADHSLYTDQAAIDLVVRHYLWRQDYRTAHSFLLESIAHARVATIAKFVETCVYESENSALVDSVVKAAAGQFGPAELAPVAARALVGYRYLQEHGKFGALQSWCRAHRLEFSTPVMQARLFGLYAERRFDEALELGRTIKSREPEHLGFPYKWALIVACRSGRFDAVQATLEHAHEVCGGVDPLFTNIMLTYSPPLTPQIEPTEWFALCRAKGWPLTRASVLVVVDQMASRYPELGARLWSKMNAVCGGGAAAAKWPLRSPSLPQSRFFKGLRDANDAKDTAAGLRILGDMQRAGIVPSYEFYERMFEALIKAQAAGELDLIKQKMATLNYPEHCAGADLAILEQQLATSNPDWGPDWARLLLREYLTQYPLSVHDTLHLTRIALIYLKKIGDPDSAAHAVDYRRLCTADQHYSVANHDAASLMVLMECKQNVDEFIYELLAHKPAIHLDQRFRRALRSNNALSDPVRLVLLEKVSAHNEQLLQRLLASIEELAGYVLASPTA